MVSAPVDRLSAYAMWRVVGVYYGSLRVLVPYCGMVYGILICAATPGGSGRWMSGAPFMGRIHRSSSEMSTEQGDEQVDLSHLSPVRLSFIHPFSFSASPNRPSCLFLYVSMYSCNCQSLYPTSVLQASAHKPSYSLPSLASPTTQLARAPSP